MGLRVKLLFVWLLLLLTPLAILGSIGYLYIDSQLKKDVINYQLNISRSTGQAINGYLSRFNYMIETTSHHPAVVSLLDEASTVGKNISQNTASKKSTSEKVVAEKTLADVSGVLKNSIHNQYIVKQYYLISGNDFSKPLLSVSAKLDEEEFVFDGKQLLSLVQNKIYIGYLPKVQSNTKTMGVQQDTSPLGQLVSVVAIHASDERHLGYLIAISNLDSLIRIVENYAADDTELVLLDRFGSNIVNAQGVVKTLPNIETLYRQSDNGLIRDFPLGDSHYMLQLDALSYDFWLASFTDEQLLFDKKRPYIIIFIMALSLTLLCSGVVYNLIVNHMAIKPVQKLIEATRQIAKGEFSPELNINTKDELGELAVAFRQMGQQLMHTSKRIRQLAYYDPLTQLPNRTTLRETLNRLLARAETTKVKCAVLFIDLDDFKKVNDRLGHEAGDELLIQISERLKNRLRQADILFEQAGVTSVDQLISRRGGDEFNAILSSISAPHDAAIVAERIIQDLNEPFFVAKSEIHVGASVGIAVFPDDGRDADTLLRNADLAMYEAKARGKNNYHIFTSAINHQVHQRLALENALQVAMVQNQFRLYYQPKVSLVDMSPVGFEALIRWQHPEKGMILPGKFIPVAEESNLIRDIGNWILGESMQQIQLWDKDLPPGVRIAINISARQLTQVDLVEQLQMMMEHFSISPQRIEIELTETSVLQDEQLAIQHLSGLRSLGVEISLDDFGTGYSSLSFLRTLPIDTVKIDRSFTANVTHNSEARAIVVSLLSLCRELNVKTIAEGIETTAQLQFLMEHGCDQGQGFLFSEPLPSDEVMHFLQEPSYFA